jgi:hypothetical protein
VGEAGKPLFLAAEISSDPWEAIVAYSWYSNIDDIKPAGRDFASHLVCRLIQSAAAALTGAGSHDELSRIAGSDPPGFRMEAIAPDRAPVFRAS